MNLHLNMHLDMLTKMDRYLKLDTYVSKYSSHMLTYINIYSCIQYIELL